MGKQQNIKNKKDNKQKRLNFYIKKNQEVKNKQQYISKRSEIGEMTYLVVNEMQSLS